MDAADLRDELERASAGLEGRLDPQSLWDDGRAARRRTRVLTAAGAAAAVLVIALVALPLRADDPLGPTPTPVPGTPTPGPDQTEEPDPGAERREIPHLTDDQVEPTFDPADLGSVPWDPASGVRSWDAPEPGSLTPLTEDPVEHAAVATQSSPDEPPGIAVLGDDGRWRAVDVTGLEVTDSWEYDLGLTAGSLSPDGTRLALGQSDSLAVVDLTSGERSTYAVTGLGKGWHGRYAFWSPDGQTVYIDSMYAYGHRAVAVDLATTDTTRVPFDPTSAAFLDDGRVVEDFWSEETGHEIRVYDASGGLLSGSVGTDMILGALQYERGNGDRWAAQRIQMGWTSNDPLGPDGMVSGVLVLDRDGHPERLLPVKRYDLNGGGGGVLGWRSDDTVLFRVSFGEGPGQISALAWNVATGEVTRVADYTWRGELSVAADHLPAG